MKPAPPDQGESPSRPPEDYFERLIESLPAAVYATDAEGLIQTCNAAAVALWGRAPAIGAEAWCGSHRIFRPDGSALPLDECPMAVALREGRSLPPEEVVIERPDGSRRRVLAHPQALKDSAGRVIGAVNMLVDISEYHEAEKAQALLASIVASSDDAIISKTLEGRITSWNEAARRIFGYSAEEAVGQFAGMLIPEERLSEEGKILDMLRRGERVDHFETIRVAKDGRRIDVSLTISPVCDRRGVIIGASKVAHDITNQKAAALALWQSEERLRLATQTGKVGIWDWDIDANRMVWSNSLHLTHGVSREASDATIEGFTALLHPEDQECFSTAIQNALDDVKPFELEFRVQRPDGGVAWLYTHALVLREGTRPVRILGATLDITQRKRAEVALCESEERYRTLAESMPFVVWQSDAQGGILYANRFFQEYSGWSADTFLASEWSPLIHPDDLENAQRRFGHSLQTGESFRSTHRLKRADGNWRWFDFSAEPVWDESGQVNRWVGAAIDIDARKRAEAKLAAVTEDLALEVHGLSRLHDLATHLAVAPELDT
ncbi:MAG TPA: PAS domain S-box protein, partial [Phycisphaerae bacterium]|nr:PAS domain S-box protein [Phycisphaerae bacterium]